ncbi:MAG TPA: DUF2652 domain-containing protein [Cyclobacteriaceae bacterium]|nr:DUF2652 domain-containing protein [Cyclobacteriaceae bacterium]
MNIFNIKRHRPIQGNGLDGVTRKGLVFIPDISGFTELVRTTDLVTGRNITKELLLTIIKNNRMNLKIAEIEGDAIFFYKWEPLPCIDGIMQQFELLKNAFDINKSELEQKYRIRLDLHLKAVAHYGDMSEFSLGGFRKLYGEVVVEAHRLLKNGIPERSYLLMTDTLTDAGSAKSNYRETLIHKHRSSKLCEIYGDVHNICFTYVYFDKPLRITA